jgi:deoxycytidylate deaminase
MIAKFKEYDPENYIVLLTLSPCKMCTKILVNAGFKHVYWIPGYAEIHTQCGQPIDMQCVLDFCNTFTKAHILCNSVHALGDKTLVASLGQTVEDLEFMLKVAKFQKNIGLENRAAMETLRNFIRTYQVIQLGYQTDLPELA